MMHAPTSTTRSFLEAKLGGGGTRDADDSSIKYIKRRSKLAKLLRISPLTKADKIWLGSALAFLFLCLLYNVLFVPVLERGGMPLPHLNQPPPDSYDTVHKLAWIQDQYAANVQAFAGSMHRTYDLLYRMLDEINGQILHNVQGGIRWARPDLLPPIPEAIGVDYQRDRDFHRNMLEVQRQLDMPVKQDGTWFWTLWKERPGFTGWAWMDHWKALQADPNTPTGPAVDYTRVDKYTYPPVQLEPPKGDLEGSYPPMRTMMDIMTAWPQEEDFDGVYREALIHFDYQNPEHLEASKLFIHKELPFKMYNVPEIDAAAIKWTDDYLSLQFDYDRDKRNLLAMPQESPNNFFCFFNQWDIHTFGLPPVRNNDMSYREWSEHAKYADAARLPADVPHFYYQAGDYKHTRYTNESSFISRDLPSFGSRNNTYFVFQVEDQAGIQCRMGERGVVAATHQDPGRNMVAMIHGAKRYILAPPNACPHLGIFPQPVSPMHRHSIVNFGHLKYLNDPATIATGMSSKEHAWLRRAAGSRAVETVLKKGEVLYIPSHWFHYIVSVQKSTQCNCRSGVVKEARTPAFGGREDVITCGQDWGLEDGLDVFDLIHRHNNQTDLKSL